MGEIFQAISLLYTYGIEIFFIVAILGIVGYHVMDKINQKKKPK